ncbi:MAG TPA: transglutaminase-like cysteine peptidase [Candidimonas sp.]|nr:transglutaminase-like cysteine peptidase [Candidimonas sp.]
MPADGYLRRTLFALCAAFVLVAGMAAFAMELDVSSVRRAAQQRFGEAAARDVDQWMDLLARERLQPEPQRLRAINDFWNTKVLGGDDPIIWRQADYWATPLETLAKRAGDCEDFVIAKYFSLINIGVAPEKLRLIYVRARVGGMGNSQSIAHMVLGYYATPHADPLVLDNLVGTIAPASQRRDLTPVFSFNAQGLYVAGAAPASVERISRWQGLLVRMQKEGFRP